MSIKLVSWNVNGIRAVAKKDEFWDWFENTDADIIKFQHGYNAAAKFVTVWDSLLDTVINRLGV